MREVVIQIYPDIFSTHVTPVCCAQLLSCVQPFVIPWTVAQQALLSMEFSRQEYWSGLPFPPPGDLPDSGIEPASLTSPASTGRFFTIVPPGHKALTEAAHVSLVKRLQPRQDTVPYEGSLRHQGVDAVKEMIHFLQGTGRLSQQKKLDSLCMVVRQDK